MKKIEDIYPLAMRRGGIASFVILFAGLTTRMLGDRMGLSDTVLSFGLGLLLFLPILGLLYLTASFWSLRQKGSALLAAGLIGLLIVGTWILHITK